MKLVVDCADGVLFAVCFAVYVAFFGVFEEFEEFTREDFEVFSGVVSCADGVYCGEFLQFDDSFCVDEFLEDESVFVEECGDFCNQGGDFCDEFFFV